MTVDNGHAGRYNLNARRLHTRLYARTYSAASFDVTQPHLLEVGQQLTYKQLCRSKRCGGGPHPATLNPPDTLAAAPSENPPAHRPRQCLGARLGMFGRPPSRIAPQCQMESGGFGARTSQHRPADAHDMDVRLRCIVVVWVIRIGGRMMSGWERCGMSSVHGRVMCDGEVRWRWVGRLRLWVFRVERKLFYNQMSRRHPHMRHCWWV